MSTGDILHLAIYDIQSNYSMFHEDLHLKINQALIQGQFETE